MLTIAELPEFMRAADKLLTQAERQDLSEAERKDLAGLVKLQVQIWKG